MKKGKLTRCFFGVFLCGTILYALIPKKEEVTGTEFSEHLQLRLNFDNETCEDSSSNQVAVTKVGNIRYETGHDGTGKALTLNEAGADYLSFGKNTAVQPENLTFSAWVKAPDGGFNGEQILMWSKAPETWYGKGYYIDLNAGGSGVYFVAGSSTDSNTGSGMLQVKTKMTTDSFFPENEWVHLAVTFKSGTNDVKIYRNGMEQELTVVDGTASIIEQDSASDKYLGASGYGNGFIGAIDEVEIYDCVALKSQIEELAGLDCEKKIQSDMDSLYVAKDISGDFELKTGGKMGSTITWKSKNDAITLDSSLPDKVTAKIERGEEDVSGVLVATLTLDGRTKTKEFPVTVKALKNSAISSVDFTRVNVTDSFWTGRQKQVICSMLKVGIDKVEATNGGFDNFIQATKKNKGEAAKAFAGDVYFLDSDTYKLIEAMSYGLQIDANGDNEIEAAKEYIEEKLEYWIPYIQGAQESDGYLDTFFTLDRGTQNMSATTTTKTKWTDFAAHEMYVDGHFYEAAVAHYRATKDTRLLDVAVKNADLVESLFGENGTMKATSGHQEIELALLKLAAACEEADADGAVGEFSGKYADKSDGYIKLAKRLLDLRGDTENRDGYYSFAANNSQYRQDHVTVAEQTTAVGHVVRAMYQYIAMTDVALLTDSYEYDNALTSLWKDIVESKSYITGGMGITGNDESFGVAYQLPVNGAYSETCGSIGSVMWNYRMNMLYGDAKYMDVLEKTLYNAVIDGVNFDGNKFFYQNPIQSDGSVERSAWFGCACCPPNLMRLIASLGGYIYTQDAAGINVNLYIGNTASVNIKNQDVTLTLESEMPWGGETKITVGTDCEEAFALRFRVPEWADGKYTVKINGSDENTEVNKDGYVVIEKKWKKGDVISLSFNMEIKRNYCSEKVKDTIGYTAIQKGPIVYVAEEADNDFNLNLFTLPQTAEITEKMVDNVIGDKNDPYQIKSGLVLQTVGSLATINGSVDKELTLIPYYAWNNRGKGMMKTYLNESNENNYGLEVFAKKSASYTSIWQSINSLNDGDDTSFWCSWIQGSVKENPWVQYEFDEEVALSGCVINWFEDSADTRRPSGITIEYDDNGEWKEVTPITAYDTFAPSTYNTYSFEPVITRKIRLTMKNTKSGSKIYALGINEWKLIKP